MTKMRRLYSNAALLLIALLSTACQPTVNLMPTPAAIATGSVDPFANTPEQERTSDILVGYVTNRLPIGAKEARFYARDFDQDLRMGLASVRMGSGEKSWEEIQQLSRSEERGQKVLLSLSSVEEMGTLKADDSLAILTPDLAQMMRDLNKAIDRSPLRDITIYVHGANNNFYRTASQAAQFRHFTARQAIVILYAWPSAESIVRYGTDIRNIRQTVPSFVRFIRFLSRHSTARKINILAYSAGATLVTEGLAMLGEDDTVPDRQRYREQLRLGAVYFAAPDTDFDAFVDEYRSYHDLVESVTVTVNPNDSVLAIAQEDRRWKAYGGMEEFISGSTSKSRLGRPDIDDITADEIEWLIRQSQHGHLDIINIDPATIPGLGKGDHDFWYSNPWVSTDALLDINLHIRPADRGLASIQGERGATIWYFPPDYEQRVTEAVERLANEYERLRSQQDAQSK